MTGYPAFCSRRVTCNAQRATCDARLPRAAHGVVLIDVTDGSFHHSPFTIHTPLPTAHNSDDLLLASNYFFLTGFISSRAIICS